MKQVAKVIRDGKVAVLYSPGYGAGWYSWNTEHPEIVFHPKLVELVEADKREEINDELMLSLFGANTIYTGGARDLQIKWLPEGTRFTINDYDGYETLDTLETLGLTA